MPFRNKLDKITIRGFQSIRHLEDFELNRVNILIGPNGAGKSNFVNYFRMLKEMVEQRLQIWVKQHGGADRLLTFGVKETSHLFSHLQFGDNGYQFTLSPTVDGGFVFTEELLFFRDKYPAGFAIGTGHTEANLKDEIVPHQWRMADTCYHTISNWKLFHFHDTSDTAGVKRYGSLDDTAYLRSDASNLAAFLYWLRETHADVYDHIRRTVQLAIPFFADFVLKPQVLSSGDQQIRLMWRQHHSDYPLWPTQLSDGSIRFICLVTALLQPNPPSMIIIDEPELGLHPYAITLLGSLVQSASNQMQIILSTQSVPLLNEFSIRDLIIVELENGVSVFKRLDEKEFQLWLEDYTVGELWEKNVLGGRP